MKFVLKDSIYDALKWVQRLLLPALATLYLGLGAIWTGIIDLPYPEQVAETIMLVDVFLGTILGISAANYKKKKKKKGSLQMQPRIEKPQAGNKYYINTRDGGYNPAKGNPNRKNKELTALPNCISIYSWFNEVGQKGQVYLKKPWYPYSVINAAKKEGLEVTKEPTAGGIMVWTGGKTGEGHVGGCAVVYDKDHILTVESEYYGKDWSVFNRSKGDGNWRGGCYWMDGSYKYQGCIKNPFMEEDMTRAETEALINEMVPKIIAQMDKAKEQEPADDWAREAIAMCIAKGLMVGYEDGFHPQSNIRREEVAQIVANLTRKE